MTAPVPPSIFGNSSGHFRTVALGLAADAERIGGDRPAEMRPGVARGARDVPGRGGRPGATKSRPRPHGPSGSGRRPTPLRQGRHRAPVPPIRPAAGRMVNPYTPRHPAPRSHRPHDADRPGPSPRVAVGMEMAARQGPWRSSPGGPRAGLGHGVPGPVLHAVSAPSPPGKTERPSRTGARRLFPAPIEVGPPPPRRSPRRRARRPGRPPCP